MIWAFTVLITVTLLIFIINWLFKLSLKIAGIAILIVLVLSTAGLFIKNPIMHKPFSINIVEYFIKINDDGSVTQTKQVTKTIVKDKKQVEK